MTEHAPEYEAMDTEELIKMVASLRQDNERLTMDAQQKDAMITNLRNQLITMTRALRAAHAASISVTEIMGLVLVENG